VSVGAWWWRLGAPWRLRVALVALVGFLLLVTALGGR
jgi:hypothetical protein